MTLMLGDVYYALLEAGTSHEKATAAAVELADYFRDKPVGQRQLTALRNALLEAGATIDKADKAAEELADYCKIRGNVGPWAR